MSATMSAEKQPRLAPERLLILVAIWHGVLMVAGVAAIGYAWFAAEGWALWQQILTSLAGLLLLGLSAYIILLLNQRRHRARLLSLGVNYLLALACLLVNLNLLGAFTGIDDLADTFGRGLPFLGLVLVGLLAINYGGGEGRQMPGLQTVGRALALIGLVVFLFAVGLLNGLLALARGIVSPTPLLLLLGLLLSGSALWAMLRRSTAEFLGATNADGETLSGYLFLSPNLLGFLVFFAGPLLLSLYVSFTSSDAFGGGEWVGLDNYASIVNVNVERLETADQSLRDVMDVTLYDELNRFSLFGRHYVVGAEDKLFWVALANTLQFVLLAVPFSVIPALILANLLNSKIPGMTFFRAVYFLPSVAAVVGIALVWQWLFNSTIGYINYFISLGVDFLQTVGWSSATDPEIRWLSDSNTALLAVIIMSAWQWLGFNTVLFLAGLQGIPRELYEAATVDGAGSWAKFWRVTLPLLAPTTFFVVITTVIQAMQVFEQVFILIPGQNPSGPDNSTLTVVLYLYQRGFQRFEQGYASAIAWVLFLLIFGATLLQFQRQRSSSTTYSA